MQLIRYMCMSVACLAWCQGCTPLMRVDAGTWPAWAVDLLAAVAARLT